MPKRLAIFTASLLLGACSPVPVHPTTPLTVENFPHSADTGFYNGTLFRRVLPGCVIRGSSCTTIAPVPSGKAGPFDQDALLTPVVIRKTGVLPKSSD